MLRVLLYIPPFLFSRVLAGLCRMTPGRLSYPIRWCELRILHFVYSTGPGGFDDAVQTTLMKGKHLYAQPIARLLRRASPGSLDERIGLGFVENVLGPPWLDQLLAELAEHHPNADTRLLLDRILASQNRPT